MTLFDAMRESSTFQAILDEGRAEGLRKAQTEEGRIEAARWLVLCLGTRRFGPVSEQVRIAIEAISDITLLEQLEDKLFEVSSWYGLMRGVSKALRLQMLGMNQLRSEELLELVQDIWDSLADDDDPVALFESQRRELDRRLAAYRANPETGIEWEQVEGEAMARMIESASVG